MDNKQLKRIISDIYKATAFFAICAIGWVGYFCINNLINSTFQVLWIDISLLSFAFLLLIAMFVDIGKTKKLQNLFQKGTFSLSRFIC